MAGSLLAAGYAWSQAQEPARQISQPKADLQKSAFGSESRRFPGWWGSRSQSIPSQAQPGRNVEFSFIQKLLPLRDGTPLSPAQISFFDIPKSPDEQKRTSLIPELAEDLRRGLGLKKWKTRNWENSTHVFEAYWPGGNRIVRIMARETRGSLRYSLALVRPGYARPALLEAELLQRDHITGTRTAAGWKPVESLWGWILPAAHAQSTGGISVPSSGSLPSTGSLPSGTSASGLSMTAAGTISASGLSSTQIEQLITTIDSNSNQLQETIDGNSAAWQIQSDSWRAESPEWRKESSEWRILMDQYSSQIDNLSASALDRVDQALALGDRALDLVQETLSPRSAALIGAAGAAGAALGGFAVNAMLDGMILGGKALIQLISDQKNKEMRLSAFIAAREYWEKTSPLVVGAEKQLDLMLEILEKSAELGIKNNDMLDAYVSWILEKQQNVLLLDQSIDVSVRSCPEQTQGLMRRRFAMREDLQDLVKVLCALDPDKVAALQLGQTIPEGACPSDKKSPWEDVCTQARNSFEKLAELERNLQTAREAIRAGSVEYLQQVSERMKQGGKAHEWAGRKPGKAEKGAHRSGKVTVELLRREADDKFRPYQDTYIARCAERCRVRSTSAPAPTVMSTHQVPSDCAEKIELKLISCELPPETRSEVVSTLGDCSSQASCLKRVTASFDATDPIQKACSDDILARLSFCTRDKKRSSISTETLLVCAGAGESVDSSIENHGILNEECRLQFLKEDPRGQELARELRRIDDAANGVQELLHDFREGNAQISQQADLRDPTVALSPLEQGLLLLTRVNKEFLESDSSRLRALSEKGARLKAACSRIQEGN
jgi:hypothetical protein